MRSLIFVFDESVTLSTEQSLSLLETLPSLTELLKENGLMADKKLGQNFLLDLNVTRKIVRLAGDLENKTIIEVGPGPGGLTRALLETEAKKVIAVEMDKRFVELHQNTLKPLFSDRFDIIEGDALEYDIKDKVTIIANLPYNIATPLLMGWLKRADKIENMALMFQKEVADRILATPSSKQYGRLSIICQYMCKCSRLMTLPPNAFTPPPKIHSSVVKLVPFDVEEKLKLLPKLETLTQEAFSQRRKMLRQGLKSRLQKNPNFLSDLGIDETLRAENLSVDDFVKMAQSI